MRRCLVDDHSGHVAIRKIDAGECVPAAVSVSASFTLDGATSTITWMCLRCKEEWLETKPFEISDMDLIA